MRANRDIHYNYKYKCLSSVLLCFFSVLLHTLGSNPESKARVSGVSAVEFGRFVRPLSKYLRIVNKVLLSKSDRIAKSSCSHK